AWLHRAVALTLAFAVTTVGLSFGIGRLKIGRWTDAAKQLGPVLGLIGSAVLVMVVVQESFLFDKATKRTPLSFGETAAVGAAMLGLMVAAISFAVRPAIDPFGLTDRWRKSYVYACECLLVLLFLHLRFNVPGLFPPVQAQAWAFIIMGISFAGVGVSELFRRWDQPVLAEPLQRTGVFLPLLPLLMFWLKPPAAVREQVGGLIPGAQPLFAFFDQIPTHFGTYALLWFLLGLLYAGLAAARRSYWYALFAALAVNAGLWAMLHDQSLAFREHPQLWLIPLALVVLASERYHRAALRPELSAGLRYLGLGLLYLSSTADLFIAGLGNSTVLPLVLAVLAVAGILLGILLRVRSYLFLGTGFLALVIFSMIWHAAVDRAQTWVWWACGIALGAAILALFAVFERRKQQVLNVVDEVRSWN
ncbi:MAG: hypothetical protein ACJ8F7_05465, partial [Gemmataceae bacterium]